jgi:hypothetical protein
MPAIVRAASFFVFALSLSGPGSICAAETIQELGLSSPVEYEAVFPQILFGITPIEVETEIVVVNNTQDAAFVEFQLFDPAGEPAKVIVVSPEDHKIRKTGGTKKVARKSVYRFSYPGTGYEVESESFVGWGILRSNRRVTAFARVKYSEVDVGEFQVGPHGSEVSFFGNEEAIQRVLIPVRFSIAETGFVLDQTGISIANPWSQGMNLDLSLLDDEGRYTENGSFYLEPHSQRVLYARELLEFSESFSGAIEMTVPPGASFSVACI